MARIALELEHELAAWISNAAAQRGIAREKLASQVLAERSADPHPLGVARLGGSTTGRRAADNEEIRAERLGR
jgi:hypothetical protein